MVALEKLNINLKKSWRLDKSPGVMITSPYRGIKHFPLPIRSCRFRFCVVTGMTFNQFKYFISLDLYVVPLLPSLCENRPCSEFFQFVFSCIRTEYRETVSLRIQSKWGEIRTRKTPNIDTFHALPFKGVVKKHIS